MRQLCRTCNGTGRVCDYSQQPGTTGWPTVPCSDCAGTGMIEVNFVPVYDPCEHCPHNKSRPIDVPWPPINPTAAGG